MTANLVAKLLWPRFVPHYYTNTHRAWNDGTSAVRSCLPLGAIVSHSNTTYINQRWQRWDFVLFGPFSHPDYKKAYKKGYFTSGPFWAHIHFVLTTKRPEEPHNCLKWTTSKCNLDKIQGWSPAGHSQLSPCNKKSPYCGICSLFIEWLIDWLNDSFIFVSCIQKHPSLGGL